MFTPHYIIFNHLLQCFCLYHTNSYSSMFQEGAVTSACTKSTVHTVRVYIIALCTQSVSVQSLPCDLGSRINQCPTLFHVQNIGLCCSWFVLFVQSNIKNPIEDGFSLFIRTSWYRVTETGKCPEIVFQPRKTIKANKDVRETLSSFNTSQVLDSQITVHLFNKVLNTTKFLNSICSLIML